MIIADPTVVRQLDVLAALREDGFLLVNSSRCWEHGGLAEAAQSLPSGHAVLVPATALAQQHVGRPVPNAGLLGGFAAMIGLMSLHSVQAAIESRFDGAIAEGNVAAARSAFELVTLQIGLTRHA